MLNYKVDIVVGDVNAVHFEIERHLAIPTLDVFGHLAQCQFFGVGGFELAVICDALVLGTFRVVFITAFLPVHTMNNIAKKKGHP